MKKINYSNYVFRKSFSSFERDNDNIPNLVSLQLNSYEKFLSINDIENQKNSDLTKSLKSFFPIYNSDKSIQLDFQSYRFGKPKYSYKECLHTNRTYSVPLFLSMRLIVWDVSNPDKKQIKALKDQEIFLCDIPLITEKGSFIFNGIQRVVVSQLRKAPGVFFDYENNNSTIEKDYVAKIIPMNGSWIDFEFDSKNNLYVRIDKKKKIFVTTFLLAIGLNKNEYLKKFYKEVEILYEKGKYIIDFDYSCLGKTFDYDIVDVNTNKVVIKKNEKVKKRTLDKLKENNFKKFFIDSNFVSNYVLMEDIIDKETGEVIVSFGTELTDKILKIINNLKIKKIKAINPNDSNIGNYIYKTFKEDFISDKETALLEIYKLTTSNENHITFEVAEKYFHNLLFSNKYDLSPIGRMKINYRLGINVNSEILHLTLEDIISTIYNLCKIKFNEEPVDDIDSLTNRRLRTVGEIIDNQFRIGMSRVEKNILEKIENVDPNTIMPQNLINSKLLQISLNDFFATSQLSQFMDQTNALSEIAHKRRITALGPGGLVRERAGFEVRDIHYTQYGRICPIETPEGQNIGLVNNLALYAQVDKYGFITTPYKKVINGVVQNEIIWLSSIEETKYVICDKSVNIDSNGKILDDMVVCRIDGNYKNFSSKEIQLLEISTGQIGSVSTNLIPFVESDDAKRSLLASNMMRQAVPFAKPEFPLIGTGLESVVAKDSCAVLKAKNSGIVKYVDSSLILIETQDNDDKISIDTYRLDKYVKTNNDTSINQRPIVKIGDFVEKGQMITNEQSVDSGEISIGKNTLIAFLPWDGYNHEDSIVVSDRLIKDEVFTSIHIQEFEITARDTRIGPEEITRDIPNVGEDVLKKLDENGIIHIGAEVKAGDILVGKITPKSESPQTPEEKLLKVLFGEKSADVRDASLYLPQGVLNGTVIDVQVYNRQGLEKDERSIFIENQKIQKLLDIKKRVEELLRENLVSSSINVFNGSILDKPVESYKKGQKLDKEILSKMSISTLSKIVVSDSKINSKFSKMFKNYNDKLEDLKSDFEFEVKKIQEGEDLIQGVLKIVKVIVATKQKLQPGDKMSGRHGNKGVVSKVLPIADMPFMEDGTPIDILLTPSGVPSRMNIGQILEAHLGWASVNYGKKIAQIINNIQKNRQEKEDLLKELLLIYGKDSKMGKIFSTLSYDELLSVSEKFRKGIPFSVDSFSNIKVSQIEEIMEKSGIDKSGQTILFDGRTGEPFERPITIGYMYMLKLYHLVDTKVHARSIGPYSLITQQPLQGKSHFGGQRMGEMECWALQGYGAAYTLQEMLTVKSDDIEGRVNIYDTIIKGDQNFVYGIPESFNVMINEVRSLGLNIELLQSK